ncbi:uncharacterized protein [Amphiura filiformis]|uniref:uncharacterized protein n=1 Tax=Amphiura filiformis TaxID=82378 RepID=UPI003B21E141
MITRKILLLLQLLLVLVAAQNDLEGSGGALQQPSDQEGSGAQIIELKTSYGSSFDTYIDSEGSEFVPSIEEALLSSDSWVVENNNIDNDIIFVEEEPNDVTGGAEVISGVEDGDIPGDDEDYVAEISGNNPLEAAEEETNVLAGLELGNARTIDTATTVSGIIGNEVEVVKDKPVDSSVHIDGNALGNTGDGETVGNPVLNKYNGLSAVLLLVAAVGIVGVLSFAGLVISKLVSKVRHKGLDVP